MKPPTNTAEGLRRLDEGLQRTVVAQRRNHVLAGGPRCGAHLLERQIRI
jgi:hypothetical protein